MSSRLTTSGTLTNPVEVTRLTTDLAATEVFASGSDEITKFCATVAESAGVIVPRISQHHSVQLTRRPQSSPLGPEVKLVLYRQRPKQ